MSPIILSILSYFCTITCLRAVSITWSNRGGQLVTPITKNVWGIERPFTWNNIDVGGRSVVIKCSDNKLVVHSPVELTPELKRELDNLGTVQYVISPNYEHLKYASQWNEYYPQAQMCACPGLPERLPDIKWDIELPTNPGSFPTEIDYVHFDCEINPFTSKPFFNEIVFYHKVSRTLFMADVYWNYPSQQTPNYSSSMTYNELTQSMNPVPVPIGTKAWKFGMDKVYLPFYKNFMVGKKGERRVKYDILVQKILNWAPNIIAPCHGDVIYGEALCREILLEHFKM